VAAVADPIVELEIARHSLQIDPGLHIWGWEIPLYLFLGGMAAGVMILTSLFSLRAQESSRTARWLAFAPPVLVSLGMGALFLDLEFKLHVLRFYAAFRWTSPMSWGAWILLVVYPVSLLMALAGLAADEAAALASSLDRVHLGGLVRNARALCLRLGATLPRLNLAAGIALGLYTGILLSTLGARALWSSALLGPLFLASGLSSGAALLLLFRISPGERRVVARWDLLAMALEAVLLIFFVVGLVTGGAAGKDAARLLIGGRYTAAFWTLVVIAGLAVPSTLEWLESRLHLRATAAAPALVLLGGLSLRWILVVAGQG
jgi:protein NrfD